jgi:hypothetical protein
MQPITRGAFLAIVNKPIIAGQDYQSVNPLELGDGAVLGFDAARADLV